MNKLKTGVLIIGGGAAGMSAALSASAASDVEIALVDDNPRLGGQIWRAEMGRIKSPEAKKLVDAVESGRIKIINNALIFAADGNNILLAETPNGRLAIEFEKLVLATGARELFLPFPGWTLPGVFGAGGLQALVKGGLCVEGKKIVVAGTGALLLAVAEYLKTKGATVAAIVEQTSSFKLNKFGISLIKSPQKLMQAIGLRMKLSGIPYLKNSWVTAAIGENCLQAVHLQRGKSRLSLECDYLACGFHLVPNVELASMLSCKLQNGFVSVDDFQQTSCENVFCAGEPTGIGGVEASLIEGAIAGLAAAGEHEAAKTFFERRNKTRDFAVSLNRTFALRNELKTLADSETLVCRCEDVTFGRLENFESWRQAKLQTRCGMGPCQGRICGAATEFLFGWKVGSVRPPIFPVKMENL